MRGIPHILREPKYTGKYATERKGVYAWSGVVAGQGHMGNVRWYKAGFARALFPIRLHFYDVILIFLAMASICAGLVPQQPPMIFTPAE